MTKKGPESSYTHKPKALLKTPLKAPVRPSGKAGRADLAKQFDLTKCKPKGFHTDRLYKMEYSKLIHQTKVVDGLKLTPLETLLKKKEIVVVTDKGENFKILKLTSSTPHLRPYALQTLRDIAKEFYKKSGGYKLLVSSLFRTPKQQNKLSKTNSTAIKAAEGDSTHFFGNTFDFRNSLFLSPKGEYVNKASLLPILDSILISYQRCGRAMGYFENAARHVIATKPG